VVGSSSSTNLGEPTIEIESDKRRFIPPESSDTSLSAEARRLTWRNKRSVSLFSRDSDRLRKRQ